jgi:non-homologous end joining protein Ku
MAYRTNIMLQLGAIALPVNLDGAVIPEESLKTVCVDGHPPTATRQQLGCPTCGNSDRSTFKKARVEGKEFTVVEADEIAQTRADSIGNTKDIIALTAHPTAEVREQTIQGKGVYYLTPSKPTFAPFYGLLADTMRRHPEFAFMGLWTPMSRAGLYEVRLYGDTLVMEARERTESLRVVQQPHIDIPEENQKQLDLLLPTLVKPYDPATYADTYKAQLDALISSKTAEEGVLGERSKSSKTTPVAGAIDLTAVLAAQLNQIGDVA